MEEEMEVEIIRIRDTRTRRNAIGPEDFKFCAGDFENDEKENSGPCLRDKTKSRLERLGVLYGDGEISSPIHRSEDKWAVEENEAQPTSDKYSKERSRRFAALASTINSWEDDVRHISPKKDEKPEKYDRFGNKIGSKAVKHEVVQAGGQNHQTPPKKKVAWDKRIINSLEMQGYKRCESEEHLVYDYVSPGSSECTSPRKTPAKKVIEQKNEQKVPRKMVSNESQTPKRVLQEIPLKKVTQEISPKKIFEERSPKKIFEERSPKKIFEERSPKKIFEEMSPKRVNQEILPKKVTQEMPSKKTTQEMPPKKNTQEFPLKKVSQERNVSPVRRVSPQKTAVLEMAAQFEGSTSPAKPAKTNKDPALLSVAEKRAVFEQNRGFVPIPQAPLAAPVPSAPKSALRDRSPVRKVFQPISPATDSGPIRHNVNQAVIERFKEIEALRHRWDRNRAVSNRNEENEEAEEDELKQVTPNRVVQNTPSSIPVPPPLPTPSPATNYKTQMCQYSSENNRPAYKECSPVRDSSPNRIKMGTKSPVRNECPPKRELPRVLSIKEKSPKRDYDYPGVKRIKISPPKPGHIYPSVSDIETESEQPESDLDPIEEEGSYEEEDKAETSFGFSSELESSHSSVSSFGRQIVRQASKTNLKRPSHTLEDSDPSTSSENESRILREMDDLLDEALGEPSPKKSKDSNDNDEPFSATPTYDTCSSASFEYSSDLGKANQVMPSESVNKTPLIHTVSVYRKQQNLTVTPTIRREVRQEPDYNTHEAVVEQSTPEEELVLDRIKELQTEVQKQLETISQASKALNLCHTTPSFSGSSAEIEAQKLLLVANARWNAINQEIDRLKIERRLKPGLPGHTERGDISISNISLPVKSYQTSVDSNISVVCVVKTGATVLHTEVITVDKKIIREGRISFQKVLNLKGLYSDFTASIEVYGYMKKTSDFICPDSKHRTTPSKKEKRGTTPKKNKDRGFMPVESPAGPNAVRNSAFQMWGFAVFSLREVTRKSFTLNKVPYTSPLEGTLELSMTSSMQSHQVEHSGFLTVYEDVSGFGAWKRRWAVLRGSSVAFWAYPDQCKEGKVAMDTIDLTSVSTHEAGLAPRELCARPHTILLESFVRDTSIQESLVARRRGNGTLIMYLLSADTKEERLQWCEQLNKVLHLLRAWKVTQM